MFIKNCIISITNSLYNKTTKSLSEPKIDLLIKI